MSGWLVVRTERDTPLDKAAWSRALERASGQSLEEWVAPDQKTWKLQPPTAQTRAALRVTFPKPMDHGLLHRLVWVTDPAGKKVPGRVEVSKRETVWSFTPQKPWQAGAYHLVADTRLEDLAGNGIGRPFEVDVLRRVEREVKKETVRAPFRVR